MDIIVSDLAPGLQTDNKYLRTISSTIFDNGEGVYLFHSNKPIFL